MIIISKIVGIDNKFGRKSRTGSNISIGVKDELAHDAQTYLMALEKDGELTGKIKKIELVIYEDGDELETIEALRATNKDLRDFIDNLDTVVKNSESLIDSVVIEESDSINLESLDHLNYQYNQGWISEEYYDKTKKELLETKQEMQGMRYEGISTSGTVGNVSVSEEGITGYPKENLPPNQTYLKLYEKSCKCETSAIVNGKCANCGGVE